MFFLIFLVMYRYCDDGGGGGGGWYGGELTHCDVLVFYYYVTPYFLNFVFLYFFTFVC